jgi:hypothetical protein
MNTCTTLGIALTLVGLVMVFLAPDIWYYFTIWGLISSLAGALQGQR